MKKKELVIDTNIFINVKKTDSKYFQFYLDFFNEFLRNDFIATCTDEIVHEYSRAITNNKSHQYPDLSLAFYMVIKTSKMKVIEDLTISCKMFLDSILKDISFPDSADKKFIYATIQTDNKLLVSDDSDFGSFFKCNKEDCVYFKNKCKSIEKCEVNIEEIAKNSKNNNMRKKLYDHLELKAISIVEALSIVKTGDNRFYTYTEPKFKEDINMLKRC